jgi:RHS repeat-associated protein
MLKNCSAVTRLSYGLGVCLPQALAGVLLLISLTTSLAASVAVFPTASWLQYYGLQSWETVLDHDQDGYSAEVEFGYGTDPWDRLSQPPQFVVGADGLSFAIPVVAGVSYGSVDLQSSQDLKTWTTVPGFPPLEPGIFSLPVEVEVQARFFRFSLPTLVNSDGDCLLDFEEIHLFHTNPLLTDTDGDGLDDCAEVMVYRTDPTAGSTTGRGSIEGRVVLDEDRDPATQEGVGLPGWMAFVDLDYDGEWDANEPSALSAADGRYQIGELDPGFYRVSLAPQPVWVQIFPARTPVPAPDGFPDRAVEVFDSGTGPLAFPYGRYVDPLPGLRVVVPSPPPDPVDASVVLGPLPPSPIAGPFGGWAHVDILAIPTNSFVTVAFDGEEIIDGPGDDLAVWCAAAAPNDSAEISLGSTVDNLTVAGVFPQQETILLDLANLAVPQPVRFVKVRGLGMVGTYPGIDLVGFEALHYRPQVRGHYDVTVAAGQTVAAVDFGVAGNDRPPRISLAPDRWEVRAGESLSVQVAVTDDLGVIAVDLMANGLPVQLDSEGKGVVPVISGGLLTLTASATDTSQQPSTTLTTLIARNADGSLPDLSGLGATGTSASGGPSVQVLSPVAGEILSEPWTIVGTVLGSTHGVARWQVHYAPAETVNPEALDAPDPDYVLLSEGQGPVIQGNLGVLAGDALPAGAYVIRVSAADNQGTTGYLGFVVGVRVDPLDIRPAITLSAPTNESRVSYQTEVRGSVTTRQDLREWTVEYAPLSQVNLQNLADPTPSWELIGRGTEPVEDEVLARFDPTQLPNDAYALRVSAWNRNGLGWAESLVLHVNGKAKLGNFAVEFTDVELPLAGVPITLKRVYDSLNAPRSGDFGYGWSLALQEADIAETVPQTGSGFGSTPFRVGTRVYLNAPDGQRVGFTFQPEVGANSFLGAAYRAVFQPDPGVRYTLEVPEGDSPFLSLNSMGEAALFFIPLPWNPDTYVLTDREGTRHTYDQADGLLEVADEHGNRVTFSADTIQHSAGPQVQLRRDAQGRITQIKVPDGLTWGYEYDAQGNLARVIYPGGLVATLSYAADRPHFLTTIDDPLHGPTQRTEYDATGRVVAIVDAAGNRREQRWDPGRFTGRFTDARGNATLITYDPRGNVLREEDPLGGVRTWQYSDPLHPDLPTGFTDARGFRTTYTYDAAGNLVRRNTPIAQSSFIYDTAGHLTRIQHGGLGIEQFEYDAQGNLVGLKSPLGNLEFTTTAHGLLASLMDGEDGLTRLEYDQGLTVPSRIILPDGGVKQFEYDTQGRITRYTDPLGSVTRYEYDLAGRMILEIDPAGAETRITYDPVFPEQRATVTDRAGRQQSYAYDTMGRLIRETAPDGAVTRYEYDLDGNRTAVIDPLGGRFEYRYDALSRLIEEVDPLGHRRLHIYDAAGNRTGTVDRNGRQRTFTYDAHQRLQEEHWLDPLDGQVIHTIQSTYDRNDELTEISDPEAVIRLGRSFVPGGPILWEEARYTGVPERRIAFDYDDAGRRESLSVTTTSPTLEPAVSIHYTRDRAGRLRILTSRNLLPPSTLTGLDFQLQFWRNARGDLTELRRFSDSNGARQVSQTFLTYSDPCACEVRRMEHVVATNQPLTEVTLGFTRDAEGALTGFTEGTQSVALTLDAAGQLTEVRRDGALVENYGYDANGNRVTSHRHASYVTGAANRLTQAGDWILTYDQEGNLVTKSNVTSGLRLVYTWDHRNRLTRVERNDPAFPNPALVEYRYDPLNRRIAVVRDGQSIWTYYDGVQPLVDFIDQESTPRMIHYSGEKLDELHAFWRRDEGVFWVLTDQVGSPRHLLDKTGVPAVAFRYDSFGNLLEASGSHPDAGGRFAFTGREWDEVAGLYYQRARHYDPDLGRFIQEDPLGFVAGDPNLYRYVGNQPLTLTDPTGMLSAVEYVNLAVATARPANFCRFAVCVNGLWNGVANAVINLVPSGPPDANCAAKLVGVPTSPTGAGFSLGAQAAGIANQAYNAWQGTPSFPSPVPGNLIGLGICAKEAGLF